MKILKSTCDVSFSAYGCGCDHFDGTLTPGGCGCDH